MSEMLSRVKAGARYIVPLLEGVSSAADAFPPLKSVAGGVLFIAKTVRGFRSNVKDWEEFAIWVEQCGACVITAVPGSWDTSEQVSQFTEQLIYFLQTLKVVEKKIADLDKKSRMGRIGEYVKAEAEVSRFRQLLYDALHLFNLQTTIAAHEDVVAILKETEELIARTTKVQIRLDDIEATVNRTGEVSTLDRLPYAVGASWSPACACHPQTRQTILEEIADFVSPAAQPSAHRIFLLTGVMGSGKTAIAHSAASLAKELSTLTTSFIFDRDVAGRDDPTTLFSTIARDLSNTVPSIRAAVIKAVEEDHSLATAPIDRQFVELILKPSQSVPHNRILTIIIDALDEARSEDLLSILSSEDFGRLPTNFRVVVTSRSDADIKRSLFSCKHVKVREIDLRNDENKQDVAVYARERLCRIAEWKRLRGSWPTETQTNLLLEKADGLFIWVATACDHISRSVKPTKQLDTLLSGSLAPGASLTMRMDKLYADILAPCPWTTDDDFLPIYQSVIGALMVLKMPLSVNVLHQLLQIPDTELQAIHTILEHFGTVLTGLPDRPVRVLHRSFSEYITERAKHAKVLEGEGHYAINKLECNASVTLCCLNVLSARLLQLRRHIRLIDYQGHPVQPAGFPTLPPQFVSHALKYACQYLTQHLRQLSVPVSGLLLETLQSFMTSRYLILWMELCAVQGLPTWTIDDAVSWYTVNVGVVPDEGQFERDRLVVQQSIKAFKLFKLHGRSAEQPRLRSPRPGPLGSLPVPGGPILSLRTLDRLPSNSLPQHVGSFRNRSTALRGGSNTFEAGGIDIPLSYSVDDDGGASWSTNASWGTRF